MCKDDELLFKKKKIGNSLVISKFTLTDESEKICLTEKS